MNASGTTHGAVLMPIESSTCFSTWSVTTSKNSWTLPGLRTLRRLRM